MLKRKSGLGANPFESTDLGIFAPTEPTEVSQSSTERLSIEISKIILAKQQPRRYFDHDKMQHLVQSVRAYGILEPLLVRSLSADTYELVAGERRYRAAKEAGLNQVPVVLLELTDTEALQLALTENLQREDLNPVEETEGVITLLSMQLQISPQEVPQLLHRLAKSSDNVVGNLETAQIQIIESVLSISGRMTWSSFASHRLPLLNLPEPILNALREGKIEYTKARAIAKLKDAAAQQELLNRAISEGMSLSQINAEVSATNRHYKPQETPTLKSRFDQLSSQLKKSKVWDDQKKRRRMEKVLTELESLLREG